MDELSQSTVDGGALERARAFLDFEVDEPLERRLPGPGARVGEFLLEREIGRGASGIVYRARQESLDRPVAVKLVPLPFAPGDQASMRRVEREGRLLASLDHPALLKVHAAGVIPGFTYLAMELVEDAVDLHRLMAGRCAGRPGPDDAGWSSQLIAWLRDVASALGAAHARGVLHRDVKPDNILIDRQRRAWLVDFGLARDDDAGRTATIGFVGTPRFASPEQASGRPLTPASDVFSLGVTAFETITGQAAFPGDSTLSVLEDVRLRDVAWPDQPRVPRDLRAVVERCLEKPPGDRYRDGSEVAEEFDRLLRLEPVRAVPRTRVSRAWRRLLRRPPRTLFAAAGLLLLALASFAFLVADRRAESLRHLETGRRFQAAYAHYRMGAFDDCAEVLRELAALPAPPPGTAGLEGALAAYAGDFERAQRCYEREIEAGHPEWADRIGVPLMRFLRQQQAPPDPDDIAGAPETPRDLAALGIVLQWRREYDAALLAYDRAVAADRADWSARVGRASLLQNLGRRAEAIRDLEMAREINPRDVETVRAIASHLRYVGRVDEERGLLEDAIREHPESGLLRADLCNHLLLQGTDARSDAMLQRAREAYLRSPDEAWVVNILARILMARGEHDEARGVLETAAAAQPGNEILMQRMAWLELNGGDVARAEELARAMLETGRRGWGEVAAQEVLAEALVERDRPREAIAAYARLEEIDAENPRWPESRGGLLLELGELDQADAALARALQIDRTRLAALTRRVTLRVRRGDIVGAIALQERIHVQRPDDLEQLFELAELWELAGEPGAALLYVDRALAAVEDAGLRVRLEDARRRIRLLAERTP